MLCVIDSLTNDENSHEGEDQRVKERPQRDHTANDGSKPAAGRGRPLGPRPPPPEHGYPYPGNHGGIGYKADNILCVADASHTWLNRILIAFALVVQENEIIPQL